VTRKLMAIGRPPLIRLTNAGVLLRLLRESGPCSKADLVRASGLSAPSVTNVVATLISSGLVETLGEGDSTGGRPPDILRFHAEYGCVGAVEITRTALRFLLADLSGRELGRSEARLEKRRSTPQEVCKQIGKGLRELIRIRKLRGAPLLRLAVGVPAIVNVDEGRVLALSALHRWNDVHLGEMLEREMKCQVMVDNDTNLSAEGESYCGAARGEKDFVFITIGEGVGAGIFLGGRIYRGAQWSAGEIGYLRVPTITREHPAIHKYGKLERALSASGVVQAWRASGGDSNAGSRVKRVADVWDLAGAGNSEARRLLKQRATTLADVIVDLALILNPSLILLGGEVGGHRVILNEVMTLLAGSEFAIGRVALGVLGDSAVLWGGISIALEPAILERLQANRQTAVVSTNAG